ncbi:putative kinetochore protein spc24 [Pseudocercospora fuligena]|uniref:Kinetochore protein Spc24 n=1 Tax=Pseudocercospora fuligena TaxID=685502 RepID=A0A8H6RV61_9PEZI|nr:putative kinetochore protein spc24 [Pseudocercospora fuligena]
MVLFDEDPVELMSQATSQFHIAPDKDALSRVSDTLNTLESSRQQRLNAQHTALKSLSRRLNNLKGAYDYEEERHDAGKHAQDMLKMDTEKFRIAKGVSDAEIESERLSGELAALKQQLETLEKEGVEGGRNSERQSEDETVLKLQFYRSLGIDAGKDEKTGEYTRAVIRNSERGDVNVVNVDGTMPKSYYAGMFWDSM